MEPSVIINKTMVVQSCKEFYPVPLLCKSHPSVMLSPKAEPMFVCEQMRLSAVKTSVEHLCCTANNQIYQFLLPSLSAKSISRENRA